MIPLVCSGRYAVGDNVLCTPVPASLVTMPTRWHGVGIGRGVLGLCPFGCSGQNAINSDTGNAGGGKGVVTWAPGADPGIGTSPKLVDPVPGNGIPPELVDPARPVLPGAPITGAPTAGAPIAPGVRGVSVSVAPSDTGIAPGIAIP